MATPKTYSKPADFIAFFIVEDAAIPTSPVVVVDQTCYVTDIDVLNPTGSTITVTITNNSDKAAWIVFPVSPNGSLMSYRSNKGKRLTGGLVWSASASGLIGNLSAGQDPAG